MIKDLLRLLAGGYLICVLLEAIEQVLMIIPTPILIATFCYLIYRILLIEGRN